MSYYANPLEALKALQGRLRRLRVLHVAAGFDSKLVARNDEQEAALDGAVEALEEVAAAVELVRARHVAERRAEREAIADKCRAEIEEAKKR